MMKRKARRTTDVVSFECDISQTSSAVSAASEFGRCSYCCCCTSCCLSRYPYRAICASRVGTPTPHPTLKHRQATAAFQPATCLPTCRQFWTRPGLSSGNWRRYQLATFFEGRLQLASVGTPRVGDPSSTKRRPGAGGESADMAAGTVVTYHINSNEDSPSTSSSPSEQRKTQPEEPAEENARRRKPRAVGVDDDEHAAAPDRMLALRDALLAALRRSQPD
ncbi:uncharacterized protein LOC144121684 isoform X8 [Amblyomma americanum]